MTASTIIMIPPCPLTRTSRSATGPPGGTDMPWAPRRPLWRRATPLSTPTATTTTCWARETNLTATKPAAVRTASAIIRLWAPRLTRTNRWSSAPCSASGAITPPPRARRRLPPTSAKPCGSWAGGWIRRTALTSPPPLSATRRCPAASTPTGPFMQSWHIPTNWEN